MRERRNNGRRNTSGRRQAWKPEYSSHGQMDFTVTGYVQKISEGDGKDYLSFTIDNPYVKGNYNSMSVEVPWEGLPQFEVGDHVQLFGMIRSWWNAESGKVEYSFVAESGKVVEDEPEPPKRSRRGVAKNEVE